MSGKSNYHSQCCVPVKLSCFSTRHENKNLYYLKGNNNVHNICTIHHWSHDSTCISTHYYNSISTLYSNSIAIYCSKSISNHNSTHYSNFKTIYYSKSISNHLQFWLHHNSPPLSKLMGTTLMTR